MSVGFDPTHFGSLTPRLFYAHMAGARKRLEREREDRIEAAWLGSLLQRQKKLPSLKTLLSKPKPLRGKEVLAMLRARTRNLPKRTWEQWCKVSSGHSE